MMTRIQWLPRCVLAAVLLTTGSCGGESTVLVQGTDTGSQTVTLSVGQELDVMLGTVGSGSYDSVPTISSPALRFLNSAVVPPYVPAGPRQRFIFVAERSGSSVITFRHSDTNPMITKIVQVR